MKKTITNSKKTAGNILRAILCTVVLLGITVSSAFAQNVNVNPGAGSYPTLAAALAAINAGTHTGAVTVDIVNSTSETTTACLFASSITESYTPELFKSAIGK